MTNEQTKPKNVTKVAPGVKHIVRIEYPHFRLPETTTEALRESLKNLPTAQQGLMTARTLDGKTAENRRFEPVIATDPTTGKSQVTAVLTKRYSVVQHAEVFGKLIDAVNLIDNKVRAQVVNDYKRAYLFVSMPSRFTFDAPDGKPLTLGFSATNSYNGTTGVVVGAFGFRLACSNGMLLTKTLGGMSLDHIQGVKHRLEALFEKLEMNMAILNDRIGNAMDEKMSLAYAEAYAQKFAGKHNAISITESFKKEKPTVWGLYNAFTDFYSHSDGNPQGRVNHLGNAENLLINPKAVVQEGILLNKIRVEMEEAKEKGH